DERARALATGRTRPGRVLGLLPPPHRRLRFLRCRGLPGVSPPSTFPAFGTLPGVLRHRLLLRGTPGSFRSLPFRSSGSSRETPRPFLLVSECSRERPFLRFRSFGSLPGASPTPHRKRDVPGAPRYEAPESSGHGDVPVAAAVAAFGIPGASAGGFAVVRRVVAGRVVTGVAGIVPSRVFLASPL